MDDAYILPLVGYFLLFVAMTIYVAIDVLRGIDPEIVSLPQRPAKISAQSPAVLNYRISHQGRFKSPRPKTALRAAFLTLAYSLTCILYVGVYLHFEYVDRSTTLTFVNAKTGAPVVIDVDAYPDFYLASENDSAHWNAKGTCLASGVVKMEWNCPTILNVTEAGYEPVEVHLSNDQLPKVIKMTPK